MVTISEGEESGEGEGLGPEVSVILGPQQDVKIPYQVAKDMEVSGFSYEGTRASFTQGF